MASKAGGGGGWVGDDYFHFFVCPSFAIVTKTSLKGVQHHFTSDFQEKKMTLKQSQAARWW